MLSLDRKIWIDGPDLPMFASFNHANGIPLNKTVVLFVGVGSLPFQIDVFNKKTIIYDFDLNRWTWQNSLPFGLASELTMSNSLQTSSAIFRDKGHNRQDMTIYMMYRKNAINSRP